MVVSEMIEKYILNPFFGRLPTLLHMSEKMLNPFSPSNTQIVQNLRLILVEWRVEYYIFIFSYTTMLIIRWSVAMLPRKTETHHSCYNSIYIV